jgi:hypothetical protein
MSRRSSRIWKAGPRHFPQLPEGLEHALGRTGDHCAADPRQREVVGGLELNDPEISLERDFRAAAEVDVERLPLDRPLECLRENARQVEVHFRGQVTGEDEAIGLRDEVVGHVDRVRDAVSFPEGLPVASHGVAVLNVIMDQEEVMEDFGRQGERQRLLGLASQRLARDEAEGGAEPLCLHSRTDTKRRRRRKARGPGGSRRREGLRCSGSAAGRRVRDPA